MNESLTKPRTRTGPKPKAIHLDPADQQLLHQIAESTYWAPWQVRRAKVVLEIANGARVADVMEQMNLSRATVQRACRQFEREGLHGLMTQGHRTGRPRLNRSITSSSRKPIGPSPEIGLLPNGLLSG